MVILKLADRNNCETKNNTVICNISNLNVHKSSTLNYSHNTLHTTHDFLLSQMSKKNIA